MTIGLFIQYVNVVGINELSRTPAYADSFCVAGHGRIRRQASSFAHVLGCGLRWHDKAGKSYRGFLELA